MRNIDLHDIVMSCLGISFSLLVLSITFLIIYGCYVSDNQPLKYVVIKDIQLYQP